MRIDLELAARNVLLVCFFVTIGPQAKSADLKRGGRPLAILLAATTACLALQNVLGIVLAIALGLRPATNA